MNKTVIITGASGGIGRACAFLFAKEGYNLVLVDLDLDALASLKEEILEDVEISLFKVDITDETQVKSLFASLKKESIFIDALINSAGITKDTLLIRMKKEVFEKVLDVNLTGTFLMIKHAFLVMLRQQKGSIINLASISADFAPIGQANYSASKAGVIALTKSAAKELATKGVRVNSVSPGFIKTKMTDELSNERKEEILKHIPMQRMGKATEVAKVILFLAKDESSYITGQNISVCGGLHI